MLWRQLLLFGSKSINVMHLHEKLTICCESR